MTSVVLHHLSQRPEDPPRKDVSDLAGVNGRVEVIVEEARPRVFLVDFVLLARVVATFVVALAGEGNPSRQMVFEFVFLRRNAVRVVIANVRFIILWVKVAGCEVTWTSDAWCGRAGPHP